MIDLRSGPAWLYRLTVDGPNDLEPASSPELVAQATAVVGAAAVQWVVRVGDAMADRIVREMPEFGGSPQANRVLRMGTESSTLRFLLDLAEGRHATIATPEALDGVVDFVRRGIGLESVLRGTRLGHAGMSDAFVEACEQLSDPSDRLADIKFLTTALFDYMDAFSAQLAGHYLEEQVRWSTSASAARLELIEAILSGSSVDNENTKRVLRYDLNHTHVGVVVRSATSAIDVVGVELQNAASAALRRIRSSTRLIVPIGAGRVWAWGSTVLTPTEVLEAVHDLEVEGRVHLALGRPRHGADGFRQSHREASAALSMMPPASPAGSVLPYASVDLISLLLVDAARAEDFASLELGPLWKDSPQNRDLRLTVSTYIDVLGSTHAAADRLRVSRNTVSYRVRKAEEVMGRLISVRPLQLRAALLVAAHTFP